MSHIIRITSHKRDQMLVWLHTPPGLAEQMGKLEGAHYDPVERAYLLHRDNLGALDAFARYTGLHVVDQRTSTGGTGPSPQECRSCAQPASYATPPSYCPACGQPWTPVPPPGGDPHRPTLTGCRQCGHAQNGRFRHCGQCGAPMAYGPTETKPEPTREHLDEPMALGDAIRELAEMDVP